MTGYLGLTSAPKTHSAEIAARPANLGADSLNRAPRTKPENLRTEIWVPVV